MQRDFVREIVTLSLREDLGSLHDITSNAIFTWERVLFSLIAREECVVCGLDFIDEIFTRYESDILYQKHKVDGDLIGSDVAVVTGEATARVLFSLERTLINLFQRASSVATSTREFVLRVSGTKAKIRGTRKTIPGLRELDLYSIRVGGGDTYRSGLHDAILIKDNHVYGCGGVSQAIMKVRASMGEEIFIAIECDDLWQVETAMKYNVGLILLDNMSTSNISKAVEMANGISVLLEASGGVNLNNVSEIAHTGVDYISVGAITHSVIARDIGLDVCCSLYNE